MNAKSVYMGDGRGRLAVSGPSNFQSDLKACVVHAASHVGGVSDLEQHRRAQRTFLVLLREFFTSVLLPVLESKSGLKKWSQIALQRAPVGSKSTSRW